MILSNDVINVTIIRLCLIYIVYVGLINNAIHVDDHNIRKHKILWNSLNPNNA